MRKKSYKISIIIPCYNVSRYIVEAIESIKYQTMKFDEIQVIIVDDHSTDETLEIINQHYSQYENVKIIALEKGSGAAGKPRNIGIQHAEGKYIMFLDPDDIYEKRACELLYEAIEKNNKDIVIGNYIQFDESNVYMHPILKRKLKSRIEEVCITSNSDFIKLPPSIWCKIYRVDFIKENNIKFPEGIACQDAVFMTECFMKVGKMAYIPENIYRYRLRATSITNNITVKYFEDYSKSRQMIIKHYKKNGNVDYFKWRYEEDIRFISEKLAKATLSMEQKKEILQLLKWFYIYQDKTFVCNKINQILKYIEKEEYEEAIYYLENKVLGNKNLIDKIKNNIKIWCVNK